MVDRSKAGARGDEGGGLSRIRRGPCGSADRASVTAMHVTSFEEFKELAQRGTFVPVHKEIVADLLTPVSAFLKIAEHSDYAFLIESGEGGEHVGRYSFLGKDPFLILRSRDGATILDRAGQTSGSDQPFIAMLRELMASFHSPFVPGLPRFTGGAVGYLGYDAAAWFEPVTLQEISEPQDEGGFMLFDTVLAFDHVRHRILIIANARITGDEDLESLYQFACAKIEFVERELERPLSKAQSPDASPIDVTSNVSREEFETMVRTAKEYIAAGDVYQVVLSQRFETKVDDDPFTVYRALLARHAPRLDRRSEAGGGVRPARRARGVFPRGDGVRRAEGAGDGDHLGAGKPAAWRLRRRRRISRLRRQPRFLHHDSNGIDRARPRLRAGGSGHRGGFEPRRGVRRDERQGARGDTRTRVGARGVMN